MHCTTCIAFISGPTFLHVCTCRLCATPLDYRHVEPLSMVLYPSLAVACYENDRLSELVELQGVSLGDIASALRKQLGRSSGSDGATAGSGSAVDSFTSNSGGQNGSGQGGSTSMSSGAGGLLARYSLTARIPAELVEQVRAGSNHA